MSTKADKCPSGRGDLTYGGLIAQAVAHCADLTDLAATSEMRAV